MTTTPRTSRLLTRIETYRARWRALAAATLGAPWDRTARLRCRRRSLLCTTSGTSCAARPAIGDYNANRVGGVRVQVVESVIHDIGRSFARSSVVHRAVVSLFLVAACTEEP